MKYGVNKRVLLFMAGIVWILAGLNVLRIGIETWLNNSRLLLFEAGGAVIVFLLFFLFVFRKLYAKHTKRISRKQALKNCPFSFFDAKGWVVMVLMIAFGTAVRHFKLLPDSFIAVFYTGLSLALIITGILFIRNWWIKRGVA